MWLSYLTYTEIDVVKIWNRTLYFHARFFRSVTFIHNAHMHEHHLSQLMIVFTLFETTQNIRVVEQLVSL